MAKELEIKILNVNVSEVEDKLQKLGCKKTLDVLQKLYVYDVMTIRGLYHSIIADWNDTSSGMNDVVINRVKQLFLELNSVITKEDNLQLCSKLNIDSLISVSQEIVFNDIWYDFLTSEVFNSIIEKYGVNANKWIRLRQTGNQVTLTVKHILENPNTTEGLQQYGLSSINETELDVESIELAREFLETLGFYHRNYQEKKRISYVYESMSLEIDSWPLIPFGNELKIRRTTMLKHYVVFLLTGGVGRYSKALQVSERNPKLISVPDDAVRCYFFDSSEKIVNVEPFSDKEINRSAWYDLCPASKVLKHYVVFIFPESKNMEKALLEDNSQTKEIAERNHELIAVPERAYRYYFFDSWEEIVDGNPVSGSLFNVSEMFYVKARFPEDKEDIRIIERFGYKLKCDGGWNYLNDDDIVL